MREIPEVIPLPPSANAPRLPQGGLRTLRCRGKGNARPMGTACLLAEQPAGTGSPLWAGLRASRRGQGDDFPGLEPFFPFH